MPGSWLPTQSKASKRLTEKPGTRSGPRPPGIGPALPIKFGSPNPMPDPPVHPRVQGRFSNTYYSTASVPFSSANSMA